MRLTSLVVISLAWVLTVGVLTAGCEGEKAASSRTPAASAYVNTVCPIMGNPIDPANVPANLTREYKGQKVAFCCAACPEKWDALGDEEKTAKLAAATAKQE